MGRSEDENKILCNQFSSLDWSQNSAKIYTCRDEYGDDGYGETQKEYKIRTWRHGVAVICIYMQRIFFFNLTSFTNVIKIDLIFLKA